MGVCSLTFLWLSLSLSISLFLLSGIRSQSRLCESPAFRFFMGFNKGAQSGVSRYESPTFRNRNIQLTHMCKQTQSRLAELPSLTLRFWGFKSLNSWMICHLAKANRYSFYLNGPHSLGDAPWYTQRPGILLCRHSQTLLTLVDSLPQCSEP